MKNLLMMGLALTTSLVFACPEISGSYKNCTTGDPEVDEIMELQPTYSIMQEMGADGRTTFTFSDGVEVDMMTEGETYHNEEDMGRSTETLSCVNDQVIVAGKVVMVVDENDPSLDVTMHGQSVMQLTDNTMTIVESAEGEEIITITCKK